jgi:hypothetical protein
MSHTLPTTAELREQYDRAGLEYIGVSFDRAIASPVILISLVAGINGARKRAARQARAAAINYQLNQEISSC